MTSSFSRLSTAPPVHSSAYRQSRTSPARRSAEPRDDVSRHNSITAISRPHRLDPTGSIPSTTASSRIRSSSTWQRRQSPSSSPTAALDMIMPILSAFIGMLKPSETLLRAFDELRRPMLMPSMRSRQFPPTPVRNRPCVGGAHAVGIITLPLAAVHSPG